MTESVPLVSILMPTLNASGYIEGSLESILAQGLTSIEVVISDGGSSDDTLQKARAFGEAHGLEVRIIPGSDTGQSHGLNRCLSVSRGRILGWLNASDEYRPGSLRGLVEALETDDRLVLAYGHFEAIDEAGQQLSWTPALPPWSWVHRHESFVTNAQAMLWKRELQERIGDFDEDLHRTMDYDLIQRFLDAMRRGEARRLDVTVGRFRRHEGQKTRPGGEGVVFDEHAAIQAKLGRRTARFERALIPLWLAGRLVRLATVLRYEGPRAVVRVLRARPRVFPVRPSELSGHSAG